MAEQKLRFAALRQAVGTNTVIQEFAVRYPSASRALALRQIMSSPDDQGK
jgi:hypothetical protein